MTETDEIPCPDILGWGTVNKLVNTDLRPDLGRKRKQVWEVMVREVLPGEMTLDARTEG